MLTWIGWYFKSFLSGSLYVPNVAVYSGECNSNTLHINVQIDWIVENNNYYFQLSICGTEISSPQRVRRIFIYSPSSGCNKQKQTIQSNPRGRRWNQNVILIEAFLQQNTDYVFTWSVFWLIERYFENYNSYRLPVFSV